MGLALPITVVVAAFAVTLVITAVVRRIALARQLLDLPNERSSHSRPTPRGGGLAFVIGITAGVGILAAAAVVDRRTALALLPAGLLVALVGYVDDHRYMEGVWWRLAAHVAAAVLAVVVLGGLPPLVFLHTAVDLGLFGDVLAVVYLVWMLNLFNFMDGIDGIAAVEAIAVCVGAIGVGMLTGAGVGAVWLPAVVAAAMCGFLVFNWPPASIFMGDVGSGFIGFVIGVLSLAAAHRDARAGWVWVTLAGVFVVDATVTLVRRLMRRERVTLPHRSHAYQHLVRRVGSHAPITLATGLVTILWLAPCAWLIASGRLLPIAGVALAYVPLIVTAVVARAGQPDG